MKKVLYNILSYIKSVIERDNMNSTFYGDFLPPRNCPFDRLRKKSLSFLHSSDICVLLDI